MSHLTKRVTPQRPAIKAVVVNTCQSSKKCKEAVFKFNSTSWNRIGGLMDGVVSLGSAVSLSADGTIVAACARYGDALKQWGKTFLNSIC